MVQIEFVAGKEWVRLAAGIDRGSIRRRRFAEAMLKSRVQSSRRWTGSSRDSSECRPAVRPCYPVLNHAQFFQYQLTTFEPDGAPGSDNGLLTANNASEIASNITPDSNWNTTGGESWFINTGASGIGHWTITLSSVSEPSSAALASIAVSGGFLYGWRRRRRALRRQGSRRPPGETE